MVRFTAPLLFLFFAVFSACLTPSGKDTHSKDLQKTTDNDTFPNGWLGSYEGMMELFFGPNKTETPVRLDFLPTDTADRWIWRMTYKGKTPKETSVKDYRWVRTGDGRFVTDEGEGLVLNEYFIGNTFYSAYGMDIGTGNAKRYTLFNGIFRKTGPDELWFELFFTTQTPLDTLPLDIHNHAITGVQRVLLHRVR